MSIWNKILIGFIFIGSAAFFYMATRTLKTHEQWRVSAIRHEEKVAAVIAENVELVDGGEGEDAQLGIDRTRLELHKLMIDRGRVWYNCEPRKIDAATGALSLATDLPDPHQITEKAVLAIFEESDFGEGGRFLGQFRVTEVAEKQLALEPTMKMTPQTLDRLSKSKGPWTLYDIMPVDNHTAFAELDEPERRAILPEGSVAGYLKDGQPADADDAPERLAKDGKTTDGKIYVRMLRDYEVLFRQYHRQRSITVDLVEATTRDKQSIEAALADAKEQEQFRQKEIAALKTDLAKISLERHAVAEHHKSLKANLATVNEKIALAMKTNSAMAGEIAKIQLEASRLIDERTNRMAQSGSIR